MTWFLHVFTSIWYRHSYSLSACLLSVISCICMLWYLAVVICISLVVSHIEHLSICSLSSSVKCLFISFVNFEILLFVASLLTSESSWQIPENHHLLLDTGFANTFSSSVACHSFPSPKLFQGTKGLRFAAVLLTSFFPLGDYTFGAKLLKVFSSVFFSVLQFYISQWSIHSILS